MNIRTILLIYGSIALVLFLYSGYNMQSGFPDLYASNDIIRYQYRANHIYLLFSSLLILLYASGYARSQRRYINIINVIIALILVAANIMLMAAFLLEPSQASDNKPLSFYGVVLNLAAVILAVFFRLSQTDEQ